MAAVLDEVAVAATIQQRRVLPPGTHPTAAPPPAASCPETSVHSAPSLPAVDTAGSSPRLPALHSAPCTSALPPGTLPPYIPPTAWAAAGLVAPGAEADGAVPPATQTGDEWEALLCREEPPTLSPASDVAPSPVRHAYAATQDPGDAALQHSPAPQVPSTLLVSRILQLK